MAALREIRERVGNLILIRIMAYVLTLLAAFGLFLWATPAHKYIADGIRQSGRMFSETTASASMSFKPQVDAAIVSARTKTTELLRKQLHDTINKLVQ